MRFKPIAATAVLLAVTLLAGCQTASQDDGASASADADPTLVTTKYGQVQGALEGDQVIFKGVPFAKPPVGDLRFAPPQEPDAWDGVKQTTAFAPVPVQTVDQEGLEQSEDCLYLNLWKPAAEADEPLPVYVWIYGGGFTSGNPSKPTYSTGAFSSDGIIQVNLTYRVNALGYLVSDELEAENGYVGNAGLLDQIRGLEWVWDNIAAFGGDPGNVTIGGESAGSYSVSDLIMSPLVKGLFQRAIMESGNLIGDAITSPLSNGDVDQLKGNTKRLMDTLGVYSLAGLRGLDASAIAEASALSFDITKPSDEAFWPAHDGKALPLDPAQALKDGQYNAVPILTGYNTDEGTMFVPDQVTDAIYEQTARVTFGQNAQAYLARFPVDADHDARARTAYIMTLGLRSGSAVFSEQFAADGHDVYAYNFNYRTPELDQKGLGAQHGLEIEFVFDTLSDDLSAYPEAVSLSQRIHRYWANFIRTGNPNGSESDWAKYDQASKQNLVFDVTDAMKSVTGLDDVEFALGLVSNS
ncbi:MAG: carboxylesterase family protein [Propionibacteriaceae bacterium]|jgi:para-nitrobenzyl esterase|nr:carboxylesterase family protein [Propionibacteriaceae bacterium]